MIKIVYKQIKTQSFIRSQHVSVFLYTVQMTKLVNGSVSRWCTKHRNMSTKTD